MDVTQVVDLFRQSALIASLMSAPILLTGLVVGLVIGLLQSLTQVQDQTVAFVPKILAMLAALIISLPWMLGKWIDFAERMFSNPPGSFY